MKMYKDLSKEELSSLHEDLLQQYNDMKNLGLNLNMARGKPDYEQLALSVELLDVVNSHYDFKDKIDYCNYGILDGIKEAKKFFADMLSTSEENIIVYGNSSLTIMFDQISRGYTHGYLGNIEGEAIPFFNFINFLSQLILLLHQFRLRRMLVRPTATPMIRHKSVSVRSCLCFLAQR